MKQPLGMVGSPSPSTTCIVTPANADGLAAYARHAIDAIAAPPQHPEWIGAWVRNKGADGIIVTLTSEGRPALSLPLEVVRKGPLRVASFMGGRHANGNFPLLDRNAGLPRPALEEIFAALRRARPDIDLVHLERMASSIEGAGNPLLQLPNHRSPNVALAVDLDGGFEGVLSRANAKRKRKKHRSSNRKLDEAGGWRIFTADSSAEVERLLEAFFQMKAHRFQKMGISNVFGENSTREFFRELFDSALSPAPQAFFLTGLEVGGVLRAVTGSSRCGGRVICEFGAIADDELASASPGDFLFYENIKSAADSGSRVYDFSVGDEPYKRLWCDLEIVQHDVLVPMSLKGRVYGLGLRAAASGKSAIKNNQTIWRLVKAVRRRRAGAPAPSED